MGAPSEPLPRGQPQLPPINVLSAQHERLILELLPFKDVSKFKEWLHSGWVQGSWAEFWRDCVVKSQSMPEPDKTRTCEAAKSAINSKSQRFLVYHPDKNGWTGEDHHVRFIITLIQDNILKGTWSESDWKKKGVDMCKAAYEVLCFLKASCYSDAHPPVYTQ